MDVGAVEHASGAQARESMCPSEPVMPMHMPIDILDFSMLL